MSLTKITHKPPLFPAVTQSPPFPHKAEALFETYKLERGKGLPVGSDGKVINLKGTIIITTDKGRLTRIHQVIYLGQVISKFLHDGGTDPAYCHTALILERDLDADGNEKPGEEDHLIIADIDLAKGIAIKARDYLADDTIDGALLVRPKNSEVRELLCHLARQSSFAEGRFRSKKTPEEKANFALKDMTSCWFRSPYTDAEDPEAIRKISYVVADLLQGKQIKDEAGAPHEFFCTAFITTLLQGTFMVHALDDAAKEKILMSPKGEYRSRDAVSKVIATHIEEWWEGHPLAATYHSNPIMRLNAQYLMTSHAAATFQRHGEEMAGVTQRPKTALATQ